MAFFNNYRKKLISIEVSYTKYVSIHKQTDAPLTTKRLLLPFYCKNVFLASKFLQSMC